MGIRNAITGEPSPAPAGCSPVPPLAFLGNAAIEWSRSIRMREERLVTGLDPSAVTPAVPELLETPRPWMKYISSFTHPGVKNLGRTSTTDRVLRIKDF